MQATDHLIEKQRELERLFDKNQTVARLRHEFANCEDFDLCAAIEAEGIPVKFGIDLLAQMALHKRADLPTLIGVMRHHLNNAQMTADMLLKCAQADLVDYRSDIKMFIVKLDITRDVQDELDKFQFPLPMVVEPAEVRTNKDVGYLLGKGSIILRKNHHEDDVCLDHINRMNKVKFTLNQTTATMVKNKWKGLDKKKEGESDQDFDKRKAAFAKYDRVGRQVMDQLIEHGNEFHFTHKYDKRGRVYCQGYHANYQGTPWNKAVIEFSNTEITR